MASEKGRISPSEMDDKGTLEDHIATSHTSSTDTSKLLFFKRWNARIEGLAGFEARGLSRVHESERHPPSNLSLLQMLLLWFSANLTINNLAVTLMGPLLFGLGFVDCALCAIFGVTLGALSTAYMATWGAVSGNRTMVYIKTPSLHLIILTGFTGRDALLHGILPVQDCHPSQHHPHGRVCND